MAVKIAANNSIQSLNRNVIHASVASMPNEQTVSQKRKPLLSNRSRNPSLNTNNATA